MQQKGQEATTNTATKQATYYAERDESSSILHQSSDMYFHHILYHKTWEIMNIGPQLCSCYPPKEPW